VDKFHYIQCNIIGRHENFDLTIHRERNSIPTCNGNLTINQGDIVVWTNTYSSTHTVTSDDGVSFSSETLSSGDTFEHQFNSAGVFDYHCNFHGSMTGTITVIE
jgi:plastocyanin